MIRSELDCDKLRESLFHWAERIESLYLSLGGEWTHSDPAQRLDDYELLRSPRRINPAAPINLLASK